MSDASFHAPRHEFTSSSLLPSDTPLGIEGFRFADLFVPARLRDLYESFCTYLAQRDPAVAAAYNAYRTSKRAGVSTASAEEVSALLLAVAPHVSAFLGKLWGIEAELASLAGDVCDRSPLWRFKQDFAKKRVLKPGAGTTFSGTRDEARTVATRAMAAVMPLGPSANAGAAVDEELAVACAVLKLVELDDVARKASKAGGAEWSTELRERANAVANALANTEHGNRCTTENAAAFALDAVEAWLAHRLRDARDPAHRWASLRAPKVLDFSHLVEFQRPNAALPELFCGLEHHRRERDGFTLTDRRAGARTVEEQVDYCLYCHERDKDSCSKGLRDNKTKEIKKNLLGVLLEGCPLDEKISEMHVLRRDGDSLGALALVCLDNPMCPGTGHRICNDCMKACVFQKQEPVNIPQIETHVLTEVLALPFGLEIYGLLTRWNPLDVERPHALPYNGKNVCVVGLGPAGYTLAHHLARDGFGVVAVDGLKIEPLPVEITGDTDHAPQAVKDFSSLYQELDERTLLGFGGVSEYGITVRWDKNFLTLLYVTLARNPLLQVHGGVRFGGTFTLDDAWNLGFDHVALAAGAGRPTLIAMKNNLARGIRKASDFLMSLQLSGAYKKSSLANLQVQLPAIVIGGGLTAIDTATELLAYYPVQIEKLAARLEQIESEKGSEAVRAMFDNEEWCAIELQRGHARELREERAMAANEGRAPRLQPLLERWGGVTLVYRRSLFESPAYRLNHEEVQQSLEEGVRYIEGLSPVEAVLDAHGHVDAVKFERSSQGAGAVQRAEGTASGLDKGVSSLPAEVMLPARTVCVAAGTSPNTMYEKEYEGSFALDAKKQYFQAHSAVFSGDSTAELTLVPALNGAREAFFTNYRGGSNKRNLVSFYGDNHPVYAGSVVKAMASAKHGFKHVAALFPEVAELSSEEQPARDVGARAFFSKIHDLFSAHVVEVNRLTSTIVEVVVKAPLAARKFKPGQFYRLQNFESYAYLSAGTRLAMEGLALTGAWIDEEKGLLGTIVLEMGASSRLCAALRPGEPIVLMGPTGAPTEITSGETVLLAGGGLGNAVLFSIARAFKAMGATVLYFAGYRNSEDLFKQDDIERYTDQVIWCTDQGESIAPRRPQDRHIRANIVQAMVAYGKGELGKCEIPLSSVGRIVAIGSDRMMAAVKEARHGVLQPMLDPRHLAIGSINSPMQCMMKEVCAQCLQKHKDPRTGKETMVFSCFNQDQDLDAVDFSHLRDRLRANSIQEKVANAWLDHVLAGEPGFVRI